MRRRGGWRRWTVRILRGLGFTILAILVTVALVLAVVLFTPWGTRTALTFALGKYDAMIPGAATVERVGGTLGGTLELDGLELADRAGNPLVRVAEARVDLQLLQLVELTLGFGELAAKGVEVHLWKGRSNWGDLAPEREKKPKEPGTVGPDLPLGFAGALAIDGVDVWRHEIDGSESTLVRAAVLHGELASKGRRAQVRIDGASALVDDAELAVAALAGTLRWDDPVVRFEQLTAVTNRGVVRSGDVELDALLLEGDVDLAAIVDVNSLAPASNLPIYGLVAVDVTGAGGAEHVWADLEVRAAPFATLRVLLGGSAHPRLDLAGAGVLDVAAVQGRPSTPLFTVVHATRAPDRPLVATLAARGGASASAVGALARAKVPKDGPIRLDAFVYAGSATVDANAIVRDKVLTHADARVDVPSLGELRRAVRPWADLPALSGQAHAQLDCTGAEKRLDCMLDADANALALTEGRVGSAELGARIRLRDGQPWGDVSLRADHLSWGDRRLARLDVEAIGDRHDLHVELAARAKEGVASVSADIAPGKRTAIDLRHLAVKSRPVRVHLVRPSHIEIADGHAEIDDFCVTVNDGIVAVNGTVGRDNDANLVVTQLPLSALDPLRLPVELDGVFAAQGRLQGDMKDPQVDLAVRIDDLAVADQPLGRFDAKLGLLARHVNADLRVRTEQGEQAAVVAQVDLRRFDDRRGPGLADGRALLLTADVENVRLARLRELAGDEDLEGTAGLTLRVSGTPEAPVVAFGASAVEVRVRELLVDRIEISGSHADGRVETQVRADAEWIDDLRLEARAPVRLKLEPGFVAIDREGDVELVLGLGELRLAALQPLMPASMRDRHLRGTVALDMVGTVHAGRTQAELTVIADDLALGDREIGTTSLEATLGNERLDARLQLAGAAARHLDLRAQLPVDMQPLAGRVKWLRDEDHDIELSVRAADIGALTRLAGVSGFAGTLDGGAHLTGPAGKPELVANLSGKRLVAAGQPVGRVDLEIEHADGTLDAHLQQRHGLTQRIDLDASVPIAIDLGRGKVHWDREAPHDVDMHVIGVDETLLRPWVPLPADAKLDLTARLAAHGNPSAFTADAELRARVAQQGKIDVPIAARLNVDQDDQYARLVIGPFGESSLLARVQAHVPVAELLRGTTDVRSAKITAQLNGAAFPFAALAPLMPAALSDPAGRLDIHAALNGTLGKPVVRGTLRLADGRMTVVPMRQRFRDVQLAVRLRGNDIMLENLTAKSGPGRASAKGRLHLARGDTRGELELRAKELPIVRPGLPVMKLSSRIAVELDATGKATEIDIVARNSTLDVFTSKVPAPETIPVSDGVTYVDVRSKQKKAEKKAVDREPLVPRDMKVAFRLADPVFIRGPQANMTWRGGIEIEHHGDGRLSAKGALVADRGRINLLGKDFELERGRVTMPERGEVDPFIDVVAHTETAEATVNVIVRGRASRPELRFTSDPPMPESDVFALLVTGSSGESGQDDGTDVQAKAASLLAAFQNPVLQRELQDSLGIDRVGVAFGDDVDQPIVTVGKRVSRKVYVETQYHHNAPKDDNTAELQVEYTFKPPSWSVETYFGDAAEGGIGLWWRKRFGKTRAKTASSTAAPSTTTPP